MSSVRKALGWEKLLSLTYQTESCFFFNEVKKLIIRNIEIREREVLRYLKFDREKTQLDETTLCLVRKVIEERKCLIKPCGVFQEFKISNNDGATVELGKMHLHSQKVAHLLRYAESAVIFVTTIGGQLEKHIEKLFCQDKPTEAVILDAAGSEAVESLTNQFVRAVNRRIAKGKKTTPRFSPGYGDWEVSANKLILKLLKAESIGVKISAKYMLTPQKTITGIWGIKNKEVASRE